MTFIAPGTPRIAVLSSDGSYSKVLYLPAPDRDSGMTLEWVEKSVTTEILYGNEVCRRYGWIPELVLTWQYYNDVVRNTPYPIGDAFGNIADFNTLMSILDLPPGSLKISPGPTAGGFVVQSVKIAPIGTIANGIATGVQITFRGGKTFSSKTLEAF